MHFRLIDGHLFETIAEELAAVRRTEAVSCLIVAGRHEHHGSTVLVRKGDGGYAALVDDPTHIDLRRPESARSVDGAVLARAMRAGRAC